MKSWIFGSPTYFSHRHSQAIPTQNLRCQVGPSGYLKYHKVAPPKMVTSPVAKKKPKDVPGSLGHTGCGFASHYGAGGSWHPRNAPHPSYTSLTRFLNKIHLCLWCLMQTKQFQVLHLQHDLRHHSICWDLRGCEAWSRCTRDCRAHSFRLGTLG